MSEKEQAAALKLLAEMVAAAKSGHMPADLIARADRFLELKTGPESHGQRRS